MGDEQDVLVYPHRRASDICPLTRTSFSSEYPPTSPKMHELRERFAPHEESQMALREGKAKSGSAATNGRNAAQAA